MDVISSVVLDEISVKNVVRFVTRFDIVGNAQDPGQMLTRFNK